MEINITPEFQNAIDIFNNTTKCLFITGKAWCWKSTLVWEILKNTKKTVIKLWSTWVAAFNIWGKTLHSFCWFKAHITTQEAQKKWEYWNAAFWRIEFRKYCKEGSEDEPINEIKESDAIIIDEVSMLRADLLDCFDRFLQGALWNYEPFWGKQIIFVGDLYQLPPILDREKHPAEWDYMRDIYWNNIYFLNADVCRRVDIEVVNLTKMFRQNDPTFLNILNNIRFWKALPNDLNVLNSLILKQWDNFDWILVCTTNARVDSINRKKLSEISWWTYKFTAKISWAIKNKPPQLEEELYLKVWCKVMILKNDTNGDYVNWTIWIFVWMKKEGETIYLNIEINWKVVDVWVYEFKEVSKSYDEKLAKLDVKEMWTFIQFPVRLAYAITIHKSQWLTFDKMILDLGSWAFDNWQAYVWLSRVTSLWWLRLLVPIKPRDVRCDDKLNNLSKTFNILI